MRFLAFALALTLMLGAIGALPSNAALPAAERSVLQRYVAALRGGKYAEAFALLTRDEQKYFASPNNFQSVFDADRLKIDAFTIVASKSDKTGTVALVDERIEFFDQAHQSPGKATAKVAYGILREHGTYAIKDPYHPWRVAAPDSLQGSAQGIRVIVRKLSFYTGRLEMVATFANTADRSATLLPYGRSSLRDESGKSFAPIASRLAGLTDKTLYTGLRLAPNAEYTGIMTFLTPDRFAPTSLTFTVAPVLFDGADAPFAVPLDAFAVPK